MIAEKAADLIRERTPDHHLVEEHAS
jgi:hypothetical protein